ncbi:MAG: tetratricopeptide repeat protein [Bacteroidetes bacterium]|nr:tetratricopeptide repeat protein [Bacteroidota bacterium]
MKNRKVIFCIIILLFPVIAFSQQNSIDSLLSLIKHDKADTNKVIHLCKLTNKYELLGDFEKGINFANEAIELANKLNFKQGIAIANSAIGNIYLGQANYAQALTSYLKALKLNEELKNKRGIAAMLGNIGVIYSDQLEYSKALDYFFKALKIDEEIEDKIGKANWFCNIGAIYSDQLEYSKSFDYYFKALKIYEEIGNKNGIAATLMNIGINYELQKNYLKALDYYFKALDISEELKNKKYVSAIIGCIGSLYTTMGKFKEAEHYLKKSVALSDSIGALDDLRINEESLYQLYDTTAQYKLALIHYKKSIAIKDTLFSQENKKQLVRKEMNFEFEKKEAATKAETEKQKAEQKIITASIAGGLFLVLVFAGFIGRSLRVTKKQKLVIEKQKQIVEEHQKEITASITYAKRLQEAILPPLTSIKKEFPESFILYLPKDIVAGDFYWMETIDTIQFIAAADCTGHGVPGAMMSVVCSNALNRAVKEFGLRDTGAILDKVTDLVLETFEKSNSEVKDGMDISILAVNKANNNIQWSGANNPLWYIQDGKMIEIKADKQPIGQCDHRKSFTTQNIEYSKNSIFYLFTDGYADQFGGPKGKKIMYRKFQDSLIAMNNLPLKDQETALQTEFQGWKGNLEQVDDVTVIGVRV